MSETVIEHVLGRLKAIGIEHIFGVPGDYAFSVQDAIVHDPHIRWVGCCNELNAAYAADGYARIHGVGAVSTTYGVGELSAMNGIAGAYAEHLPVFHLVGTPTIAAQTSRALVHHTLGDGEFDVFRKMAEPVVCASAVMSPHNVAYETERLITAALYHCRPVYMAFPSDLANAPVLSSAQPIDPPRSDPASLQSAIDAVLAVLSDAKSACVLPGLVAMRAGLSSTLQSFVDAAGLPFATMFADKSVLDEQHPAYLGLYDGRLTNEAVRTFVESCDCVVLVGTRMTDFNSGAFTARLDPQQTIDIGHHHTTVGTEVYPNVEMGDILNELTRLVTPPRQDARIDPTPVQPIVGSEDGPITAEALYPRWADFLKPGDIVIAETGTASMGLAYSRMPTRATFQNQTLWGSIGWATPAALGAAVAAPERRVILITGDGSHQLTAQEISQLGRRGLKPIIFVLNNSGYLIERLLCADPGTTYNDIASWRYTELPHALGCDNWFTARVATCGELDHALKQASQGDTAAYIEVVTDTYAAPPLAVNLHTNIKTLYQS
jgi:indolepyruvate decarboxylase